MKKILTILVVLSFIGCEKPIETQEKQKQLYYGTCKIKVLDTEGNYTGTQYLIANETYSVDSQLQFVDSCNTYGGLYVNENDSNGRMCYTCIIGQVWFPE
jgi:hypothetical protein